ncbi:alpha/beta hydrolase [Cellulophaga sp. E16_2]|uniref:Alpha/beta hydrolase fold protein n=1 Tax=Cellulophaga algicola (strain DSM 14237 / IC166 / ACAM 630) TaxID=688270 RepID=E6XCE2_CELAD|nr:MULTISPECIES: alpha/beta hydrolase [Cellulophaga]ADV47917.1 alpha/beta hydrolase fold protein [Cellulophaga algicola DSM 14237]MBO0590373.1 alpha/beta hydrolase [Cellulophaga sp. E16_2]
MKKALNKYIPLFYGSYFNSLALVSKEKAAQKAFELFCTPRKGCILEHQKEFLNPAKSEIISAEGVQLQTYKWQGKKETVLLLHGWESNVFRWRNLIGYLQNEDYNVIAFDAPGQGNSSGNILNVPLYTLCAEKIIATYNPKIIIGHSMGGMTVMYNEYKHPNNSIQKIVSLGSPSELSEIVTDYQNLLKFNSTVKNSLNNYFKRQFKFTIEEFSIAKFSKKITKKGLIIHDEFDKIAPYTSAEQIHRNWKNSRLIKTEGLGHSLHQEVVNEEIIAFLKSE